MDNLEQMKRNITLENLEPKYREIAEIIGRENYLTLCDTCGGGALYIPTVKEVSKKYIYDQIKASEELFDKRQLAQIYGVSLRTVYNILNEKR